MDQGTLVFNGNIHTGIYDCISIIVKEIHNDINSENRHKVNVITKLSH